VTDCALEKMPDLAPLVNLELLNLAGNRLRAVSDLSGLHSLWYLNLSRNHLDRLPAVSLFGELRELYCTENFLDETRCDALLKIGASPNLDILEYNPQQTGILECE